MDIDGLLLDLEIIKQLKENDKLAVYMVPGKTRIFVDSNSYISSISRKYHGYNRESCIDYIEKLINDIEKSSSTIITGNHTELGETLKKSINSSIQGFENLTKTYKTDSTIVANLALYINRLTTVSSTLDNYEDNLHVSIREIERDTPIGYNELAMQDQSSNNNSTTNNNITNSNTNNIITNNNNKNKNKNKNNIMNNDE